MIEMPGTSLKRVMLLHDKAHPHTAVHTVDTLCALKFEVLKHTPYSPDLVPSEFNLLGLMKEHLRGQKFADDEVIEVVQSLLKATPKSFFIEGIHKLVDQVCCEAGGLCQKIRHKQFL
jgi:histone-lysine N-methyltransferase SETMAR